MRDCAPDLLRYIPPGLNAVAEVIWTVTVEPFLWMLLAWTLVPNLKDANEALARATAGFAAALGALIVVIVTVLLACLAVVVAGILGGWLLLILVVFIRGDRGD